MENLLATPVQPFEDDINVFEEDAPQSLTPDVKSQLRSALKDDLTNPAEPSTQTFEEAVHASRQGFVQEVTDKLGEVNVGIDERVAYAKKWADEIKQPSELTEELAVVNAGLAADGSEPMQMSELDAEKEAVQSRIDEEMMRVLSANRPDDESVPGMIADVATEVLDPFSMQGIISVAKAVGIETSWTDRFNPGAVLLKVRAKADEVVRSRDQAAIKAFFNNAGWAIRDSAALAKIPGVADAGGINQWMLSDYIFSGRGSVMEGKTATNIYNGLDLLTLGLSGAVRKGVSHLYRLTMPSVATSKAANALSRSQTGAEKLLKAANSDNPDAALRKVGTDAASVVSDHVVPKTEAVETLGQKAGEVAERPYYENIYFDKGERLAAKQDAFIQSPSVQLNQSWIDDIEGGFKFKGTYFDNTGKPFKTKAALQAAMDPTGQPYTVVQLRKGAWAAQTEGTHLYEALGDVGNVIMGERANSIISNVFGKNAGMSTRLIDTSDAALRLTEQTSMQLREMAAPYAKLLGDEAKRVDEVLDEGDRLGQEFTTADLLNKGLTPKQMDAYNAAMRVSKATWEERNAYIYQTRLERGHKSGTMIVKGKPASVSGKVVDKTTLTVDSVLDGATGKLVKVSSLPADAKILKVEEGVEYASRQGSRRSATHVLVPSIRELDRVQMTRRAGHIDRRWNAPAYVVAHVRTYVDGVERIIQRAVGTAPSRAHAAKSAAKLNQAPPKGVVKYDIKDANELSGADTLAKLEELGMTRSGKRDDDLLWDTEGRVRLETVSDSLNRMMLATANQRGIGRWTEVMIQRLRRTISGPEADALVGKHGELNVNWVPPTGMNKDNARKVKAVFDYVLKVNGLDRPTVNFHMAAGRDAIAEFLYGASMRVGERNLAGRALSGFGRLVHTNGEAAQAFAKSATYVLSMALNPIRQRIMQASMAPTYMAAEGATKYALSGRWGIEQTALGLHLSGIPQARKLAADLGMGGKDFDKTVEGWKELGYEALVSGHMFALGTVADGRIANRGRVGRAFETFVNKMKGLGVDAGVRTDLRSAYLVSLNRFKGRNGGRYPRNREEWQEVGSFSSQLALNMNKSDTLMAQKGWASVALQFMAHQFKMSARIMSGATALLPGKYHKIMAEGGLSRAERIRLGAYQGLMYGGAGYGVANLGGQIQESIGKPIPQEVKTAIDEGAVGYMASRVFSMAVSPDDPVDFAVSEAFAPANFVGGMVSAITSGTVFKDGMHLTLDQIPSTGMGRRFYDSVKMGAAMVGVAGDTEAVTDAEAYTAAAQRVLQSVPLVNNVVKGLALWNSDQVVDSTGTPVQEAAGGAGWMRALMGVATRDEVALQKLERELRGAYRARDEGGKIDDIRMQADADWNWIEPLVLGKEEDGVWDMPATYQLLEDRARVMARTLGPVYGEYYREALQDKAEGLFANKTKAARLAGNVEKWLNRGNVMATEDLAAYVRSLPKFEGQEDVVRSVEFYLGAYNGPEEGL